MRPGATHESAYSSGARRGRADAQPSTSGRCDALHQLDAKALAQLDLDAQRSEYLFRVPGGRLLCSLLVDERDEPIAHLLANQLLIVVPAALLLFRYCHSHWLGLAYLLANYALFLQRFMLTLHVTEHRRLFKRREAREVILAKGWLRGLRGG
jgi:hypothetical protein